MAGRQGDQGVTRESRERDAPRSAKSEPAFDPDLRHLLVIGGVLVAALLALDIVMDRSPLSMHFALTGIAVFWCLPLVAWTQRHRIAGLGAKLTRIAENEAEPRRDRPLLTLFLISFVVLFVETMLIRYIGSQTRIFAFYKNIPLIGAFLGLGVGCYRGGGGRREILLFLAGMAAVALFFALAAQALGAILGTSAALASSERVFGYGTLIEGPQALSLKIIGHVHVGLFCVAVFLVLAWLFGLLGRILGQSFEAVPRLRAYTANILGSLAGLAAFVGLSALHTSPWLWFLAGLLPLLLWLGHGRALRTGLLLVTLAAGVVAPSFHHTVWSAYQKLVGHPVADGYEIDISDAFYQIAIDLRPEAVARRGENLMSHYDYAFTNRAGLERVLVDAVDIDAAIVEMGRLHHPERPYDDPRVSVIVDDARHAFKTLPPQSYDQVMFGFLDSHTALGASSVRLDNYVFTQESFAAAARLVRPGGTLVLSVVTAAEWLRARFGQMLEHACGAPVDAHNFGSATVYICHPAVADPDPAATGMAIAAPVDDWPFPYLPDRSIPLSYVIVIAMLAAASIYWLRRNGIGAIDVTPTHAHMFFLGAAFLLMEVYAINRLALLFGTTWLVSAVSIAAMLVEIVAANLLVGWIKIDLRPLAYLSLAVLLIAGWFVGPEVVLGQGPTAGLLYALFLLSPVFCAGIVFATSFARSARAGMALGANILGAVLGGWVEYATMATGIRAMALVALALYLASALALLIQARRLSLAAE
jgi:SAM-dependent methyltransferase